MGRKNRFDRPLPRPAVHDPALLDAVRGALAALSAPGKEAAASAIEEWIKLHRHEVWLSIRTASALREAIEAARREEVSVPPVLVPAIPEESKSRPAEPITTKRASPMARKKKVESLPEPPAKAEPAAAANGGDQETLAEVVRKALSGVGVGADNQKVKRWISRHYPGRKFNASTLNTTISGQRSRMKRESSPPAPPTPAAPRKPRPAATPAPAAPPRPRPRPSAAPDYDPTRSELLRVLEIARQESSVGRLRKLVLTVKDLADRVGGLDRLAVCLDTLEEFGIK
jgi:hypothetical protein